MSIEQMRRLRILGVARPASRTSKGSVRLEGDLTRRAYDLDNPVHNARFVQEVAILDRLRGASWAPQLVHVDLHRGEIYHTSVGLQVGPLEYIFNGANLQREINETMLELQNRYKIVRRQRIDPGLTTLRLPLRHLTRDRRGKLVIVGFDDPRWKLLPA